jgi:hypothetical protein
VRSSIAFRAALDHNYCGRGIGFGRRSSFHAPLFIRPPVGIDFRRAIRIMLRPGSFTSLARIILRLCRSDEERANGANKRNAPRLSLHDTIFPCKRKSRKAHHGRDMLRHVSVVLRAFVNLSTMRYPLGLGKIGVRFTVIAGKRVHASRRASSNGWTFPWGRVFAKARPL